jgi:hypothetical protein
MTRKQVLQQALDDLLLGNDPRSAIKYLREQLAQEGEQDRQLDQLIQERDHRDEIINKLCDAVLGPDRNEWSSMYSFEDAVREAEERMHALTQGVPVWYHAECADPDYSRFTQDKAEAHAIVSDKGGYVTELFAAAKQGKPPRFPAVLRKMWSGTEVQEWINENWSAGSGGTNTMTSQIHPDDIAVDKFAAAMKDKMAKQRAKGYGGWQDKDDCPAERLQKFLVDHIPKGDPVDVGNFAMMLFSRGEGTATQPNVNNQGGENGYLQVSDVGGWNARHDGIGASSYQGIKDANGVVVALAVAHSPNPLTSPSTEEHARRLVACWNACDQVGTNFLEAAAAQGGMRSIMKLADSAPASIEIPNQ